MIGVRLCAWLKNLFFIAKYYIGAVCLLIHLLLELNFYLN